MKIISRAEAKAAGLKRYFTGKPCPQGHVEERQAGNGECIECLRIKAYARRGTLVKARKLEKAHPDLVSRREARILGLNKYFTGIACKYGHESERLTGDGVCTACIKRRGQTDDARAKQRAGVAKYYRKNSDRIRCQQRARQHARRAALKKSTETLK